MTPHEASGWIEQPGHPHLDYEMWDQHPYLTDSPDHAIGSADFSRREASHATHDVNFVTDPAAAQALLEGLQGLNTQEGRNE